MNLTPHQKRQLRLVITLVIGVPLTVFAVYKGIQLISRASGDATPQDVIASNLTTSALTVSWVTDKATEGSVIPVLNGTEKSPVLDKRGAGKRKAHYVVLKGLEPATEYSFIIVSDDDRYTKGTTGEYKFTTAPISENVPGVNPSYGTIKDVDSDNSLVYVLFKDKSAIPVSTDIPSNGNWIAELSAFRSISDRSYLKVSDNTELVVLVREGITRASVLEGSYSTLFNASGRLKNELILEDVEPGEVSSYFPTEALLGDPDPIPEPEPVPEPVPEPTPTPEPNPSPVPNPIPEPKSYSVRHEVDWSDLSSGATTLDLISGEESVTIVNLSDIKFGVAWRSENKEIGYVKYGTDPDDLKEEMIDIRDSFSSKGEYYSHLVESDRLEAETTYYFEIYSGGDVYDSDGDKYSFTTFPYLDDPPPYETREVSLLNASNPTDWVLIFQLVDSDEKGTYGESGYLASIPDENGSDVISIADARSDDGLEYYEFLEEDVLRVFFLGKEEKTFDFNLAQNEIELDINNLGGDMKRKVELLLDYGITQLK
jgi:hypothetical protein